MIWIDVNECRNQEDWMVKIVTMYEEKISMNNCEWNLHKWFYIYMIFLFVGLYENMGIYGFVLPNSVLSAKPTDFFELESSLLSNKFLNQYIYHQNYMKHSFNKSFTEIS